MSEQKIYIWNWKQWLYGVRLSFSRKDLETMQANLSEKWYINLNLNERKEVGKFWETHSMTVDTWKPEARPTTNSYESNTNILDVPF